MMKYKLKVLKLNLEILKQRIKKYGKAYLIMLLCCLGVTLLRKTEKIRKKLMEKTERMRASIKLFVIKIHCGLMDIQRRFYKLRARIVQRKQVKIKGLIALLQEKRDLLQLIKSE